MWANILKVQIEKKQEIHHCIKNIINLCWKFVGIQMTKPIEKVLKEKNMIFCDNLVLKKNQIRFYVMKCNLSMKQYNWNSFIVSHLGWTQS
jgi:peroxiredoxin family protein